MPVIVISVVFLIALSVLFSVGETALTGASEARIYQKLKGSPRVLEKVRGLLSNRDRFIGVLLIGNNVVNIIASALTTAVCVRFLGENLGVLVSTMFMSLVIVIFAEVVPKTYAVMRPDQALISLAPFILATSLILKPISWTVYTLAHWVFRLPKDKSYGVSPHEEVMGVIDMHHKDGGFVKSDRDMLGGILTLKELLVADVMIHRKNMVAFNIEQPGEQLIQEILGCPHTRLPLYREDPENIVGIVHAKDVLLALAKADFQPGDVDFSSIIKPPWFVPESTKLKDQLNRFLLERSHFALVVDEYGALMGLITLEDILEEIVGSIADEHDVGDETGIRAQEDGSYLVRGDVPIRDVNRMLDLSLPDDEAITMAGLVITSIQAIPESGQVFTIYHFRFEILKRQDNQITLMRMTPVERQAPPDEPAQ